VSSTGEGSSARRVRRWGAYLTATAAACGALSGPAGAAPLVPTGNMLANPGAEQGPASSDAMITAAPPGWSPSTGMTQVRYGTSGGFPGTDVSAAIDGANAFFAGGDGVSASSGYQIIFLTAAAASIDAGRVRAQLSGDLGGVASQDDSATLQVEFADQLQTPLGSDMIVGPVTAADRGNVTTLLPRSATATVPPGTRRLRMGLDFSRVSGAYNDGYADNVSLVLRAVPIVHTTAADQVGQSTARVAGTVDDGGSVTSYRVEYGATTAYGSHTADIATAGAGGQLPVQVTLGGLTPGSDYHARLVADGPDGPVAGEDVTFHTTPADTSAAGLPAGLDFTWSPRADVQIAGAPAGGLQFQATPGPGVAYAWDFDFHDGAGFQPDPAASGDAPRHGFTTDGAHDGDRVTGADGQRRRLYTVRLRATAANGTSAEIVHDLVVMPNHPPKVDFTTRRADTGVNHPVTFTPLATDPDQGPRTADQIDHLEWDFDPPAAGGQPDLICAADGTACHLPDSAALPGPWFSTGDGHQAVVNFFERGLAAHNLAPLATIDLNALPASAADGRPLAGAIGVRSWSSATYWIEHDPRLSYLYDNATLLQQSTFDLDAGEVTGAQLKTGATLRKAPVPTTKIQNISYLQLLAGSFLQWRGVTLTAVDSAGARTSVTHTVPLVPDQPPKLKAQFVNRDPNATTVSVFRPGQRVKLPTVAAARKHGAAHAAETTNQHIDYPLTTADELAFDASASSDPDGSIAYYTLEVGQPLDQTGVCAPKGPPLAVGGNGPISLDNPVDGYGPGQFFPGAPDGGAGPIAKIGAAGSLPGAVLNPRGLKQAGFQASVARAAAVHRRGLRATPSGLPTLATLLGTHPLVHPCVPYSVRNVIPGTFKVRGGTAAARPLLHAASVPSALLTPRKDLEFDTTALVTRDPADLRFRIPVPGKYSVAVSAYDDAGLGATQRTDGFEIVATSGTCQNIAGQSLTFAKQPLVFSGQCMDYGGKHRRFWTTQAIDINGVGLRPSEGSALYLQLDGDDKYRVFATRAHKPADFAANPPLDAKTLQTLADDPGSADVMVDGQPVAHFSSLTRDRAAAFVTNDHAAAPAIPDKTTYNGSPVARPDAGSAGWDAFAVTFAAGGRSTIRFRVVLPAQFSRDDAATSPTADVVRPGVDEPRSAPLTTNTYADIARQRARDRARAHAASLLSATLDLSGTTIGPVTIVSGRLQFDAGTGLWKGDIDDALLALGPQVLHVGFHILIADGELKEARGSVSANPPGIPVFANVYLNEVRFSIVTDPLTVSGGATFSFANVLTGDLDLTIRTDPVFLRLEGRIRMMSLELGGGFVQYDEANNSTLTFGGHFGLDFGPASLEASLQGGVSFGTGDFYIQGAGHACLWACLDVQALASSIAVAGCGSIDLFVGTISAGLAYKFDDGLDLFTGCDLEPYKPAVFRRAAVPAAPPGVTVPAGTEQAAFKFYGDPALPGAPKLSLTAPDGRVFSTASLPGDYAFSPPEPVSLVGRSAGTTKAATALIDQNVVDHVSTVLVANPAAGEWHVTPAAGSPAPARVELAVGQHITAKELQAPVVPAKVTTAAVRIGKTTFRSGAHAAATTIRPSVLAAIKRLPEIEQARTRGVVLDVPKGLTGTMTLIDQAPHGSTIVRTFDVSKLSGKVPIAFVPSTEPGQHLLQAFLANGDGIPRQQTVVDRFTAPALPAPSAPGLQLHRSRSGASYVDVDPGTAGAISGTATTFDVVVVTSAGQRVERSVDGRVAKSIGGGRFRVQLGRLGGATVKLSARMRYGSAIGRVGSDTIRSVVRR
jgi:hypothetical protein